MPTTRRSRGGYSSLAPEIFTMRSTTGSIGEIGKPSPILCAAIRPCPAPRPGTAGSAMVYSARVVDAVAAIEGQAG